ncbi:hypothetical protein MNBD_GAMMA06-2041 [hydrothermal vent metagenome]|uniref:TETRATRICOPEPTIDE REPEAT FAMILY PROTEIN n=1 Tax=hydrothermal vent metagenome TaxID=652676 RepID=A0A3B0X4M6_9ZZZZ
MKYNKNLILVFLSAILIAPFALQAADISQSSSIVKFQHKLASKGNPQAQYRLAYMFENGDGTKIDLKKAKYWYDLAAQSGLKAAQQRKTYLKVKQKGFDAAVHADWLAGIKTDAEANKPDAILLQAQIYYEGIGTKKDLNKSLELYYRVSVLGEADVEEEIAIIDKEIAAKKRVSRVNRRASTAEKKTVPTPGVAQKSEPLIKDGSKKRKINPVKSSSSNPAQSKPPQTKLPQTKSVKSTELSQAEKIKRYEKAREKLLKEQALIDELQNKMSGGNGGEIDDEI